MVQGGDHPAGVPALALPAGALADIIDKRLLILGTQSWMLFAAATLAVLTYSGQTGTLGLLALTFAIGIGSAMNSPAWGSVMAEVVPRQDLVQAIAPRMARRVSTWRARVGPAIAGVLVLAGGPGLAFALNALSAYRGDRGAADSGIGAIAATPCRASTSSARCAWACGSCGTRR